MIGLPLFLCYRVLAQVEGPRDPNPVLRLFLGPGILVRVGRAHEKLAQRESTPSPASRLAKIQSTPFVLGPSRFPPSAFGLHSAEIRSNFPLARQAAVNAGRHLMETTTEPSRFVLV